MGFVVDRAASAFQVLKSQAMCGLPSCSYCCPKLWEQAAEPLLEGCDPQWGGTLYRESPEQEKNLNAECSIGSCTLECSLPVSPMGIG